MIPTGNAVQHALRQGRHVLARALHRRARWRSVLCCSSVHLDRGGHDQYGPEFTSLGLNATMINEGQR